MDELAHKTICKRIDAPPPGGFKAFLSTTFVNILFLWPWSTKIKSHIFHPNISVHSATRGTSGEQRRAVISMQPHSGNSAKWQKQLCIMRVDDNNNSVPDCGLWKSHLQLLNWKACSSNPEVSDWDVKETKRWREGGERRHGLRGSNRSTN